MMPSAMAVDDHAFPTKQLTILAICRFSEPIAFNSILAYTYVMVQDLHGGDDKDASFYAGLLVSAYAVAEAITAMGWGALSDRYGRKPIVLFGLAGVAISSLIFGLAERYWVALLARFVGGALNGNVAVMQTMVAEMVKKPEHEPKAYASQPFVWTLGGIIGSAMGGFLAQPAKFYPDTFAADGIFGRYPYLLPNLVSVGVIVLAILQGLLFLEETNPRERREAHALGQDDKVDENTPFLPRGSELPGCEEESLLAPAESGSGNRRTSFGTVNSTISQIRHQHEAAAEEPKEVSSAKEGPFNFTNIMVILAYVLVSYHQMAFGSLLPVHLLDKPQAPKGELDLRGGMGYTVHDVGVYLAVNGFIGLFIQAFIFPTFVDIVGVWKSFVWIIVVYPSAYMIMPFISAFPGTFQSVGIYASMVLQSFFGIITCTCALILIKDATPRPSVLGTVNGLAMAGCCLARTISPPLAGIIFSAGGSAAAWFSCAGMAVLAVVQLIWIPRKHVRNGAVDDMVAAKSGPVVTSEEVAEDA